ncbi:MAG: hypothetical protein M3R38_03950 [Actinomycetota bacterium]|nr:hypothetical protein [Actinomycetota bacterium]
MTETKRGRRSTARVGKMNINIDPDLHLRLKRAALDDGTTVTGYVTRLIEGALDGTERRGSRGRRR